MKNNKKGFTLIEVLVVVLIIGILAAIALPQYQIAVTKAKVAAILPLMRVFKDALTEYKLQHDYYADVDNGIFPDADTLGVTWPSDWECSEDKMNCWNDYWYCFANEEQNGMVYCSHETEVEHHIIDHFCITMYQIDDQWYENFRGMIVCSANSDEGHKICKALGGKKLDDGNYQL